MTVGFEVEAASMSAAESLKPLVILTYPGLAVSVYLRLGTFHKPSIPRLDPDGVLDSLTWGTLTASIFLPRHVKSDASENLNWKMIQNVATFSMSMIKMSK